MTLRADCRLLRLLVRAADQAKQFTSIDLHNVHVEGTDSSNDFMNQTEKLVAWVKEVVRATPGYPASFFAILPTCSPWKRAIVSSFSDG